MVWRGQLLFSAAAGRLSRPVEVHDPRANQRLVDWRQVTRYPACNLLWARDFVSRFLGSLGCFNAGMRLVHEWRPEILGSIEGILVGMEKMKGYD